MTDRYRDTSPATFEPQIYEMHGKFYLTIAIVSNECEWVSHPVELKAETWEEARREAAGKVIAAKAAILGENISCDG